MITVLSLCDFTGNMVKPWAEAGCECHLFDIRHDHPGGVRGGDRIVRWNRRVEQGSVCIEPDFVTAFPPCTHLANSGNRWKRDKGLPAVIEALQIVNACRDICEASGAPYMIENPVGSLSTYWRPPDYYFQPWQYGDMESKKTCLWTGGGFVMPEAETTVRPDGVKDLCWKMGPCPERGNLRSVTPPGFARAVFEVNYAMLASRLAATA